MSKIIISHDVDHISSYEHWNDLIIPKYIARSILEKHKQYITYNELARRMLKTISGNWNFVKNLSDYNISKNIKANFFFATQKGIGLAYSAKKTQSLVEYVIAAGHEVGIHGIARDTFDEMKQERNIFQKLHNQECNGIRFHYLYPNDSILSQLDAAGYAYDTSLRGNGSSRIVGNLIHFPVHIMDGDVLMQGKRYQSMITKQAIDFTTERISTLIDRNTDYISILFHDRYFSNAHTSWKDWYMETIEWIQAQSISTTTYEESMLEIRKEQQ